MMPELVACVKRVYRANSSKHLSGVSDQTRHKPACADTEATRNLGFTCTNYGENVKIDQIRVLKKLLDDVSVLSSFTGENCNRQNLIISLICVAANCHACR